VALKALIHTAKNGLDVGASRRATAVLNLGSKIQPHLFEDRMMKADTIVLGAGCSIGSARSGATR